MPWFIVEIRNSLRSLSRSPWYALTAIAMLGAGLGLTMYMFGAINAFMLKPLPFPDSDRIAHMELSDPATGRDSIEMPLHEYVDLAREQKSFDSFGAYSVGTVNLSGDERPERFEGGFVTEKVFEALRTKPMLGRDFAAADYVPGAAPVAVIGYNLWQMRFQGLADVVGRSIRVNGKPATVVGVMPQGFRFPVRQEVWVPVDIDAGKIDRSKALSYEVVGRLKPGVGFAQAQDEMEAQLRAIAARFPGSQLESMHIVVKPLNKEYVGNNTASVLTAMMIAVLFVLLIACANVANLMVARTVERSRELAIHAALGADRRRLIARMIGEGLLISLAGGALGFVLAQWGGIITMRTLTEGEEGLPYWMQYSIDYRSVLFAFVVAAAAALLATWMPALRAGRTANSQAMRQGGYGATGAGLGRLTRVLVAGEIALCAVLLVLAGLTVRSIVAMQTVHIGADTANVLSSRIALFEDAYPEDAQVVDLFERLEQDLRTRPGVLGATMTSSVPATFANGAFYQVEGSPPPENNRHPYAFLVSIAPSYFDMFKVPVLRGRAFQGQDRADAAPVAIVNQAFAERQWPKESALGKRIDLDPMDDKAVFAEIVGVVPTVLQDEPEADFREAVYVPLAQHPTRYMSVAVRASGDPHALADTVRSAVNALDKDLPIYFVRTVDEWIAAGTVADRLMARLFVIFAAFGVLLAGAGIYAVLAFTVASRTREIGVRRALGALDAGILGMLLRQGMTQLAIGLGIGLVLAVGFAQILGNVLFGVSTFDPVTFAGVAVVLAIVVVVASLVPTRRALGVQPMQALRYE